MPGFISLGINLLRSVANIDSNVGRKSNEDCTCCFKLRFSWGEADWSVLFPNRGAAALLPAFWPVGSFVFSCRLCSILVLIIPEFELKIECKDKSNGSCNANPGHAIGRKLAH